MVLFTISNTLGFCIFLLPKFISEFSKSHFSLLIIPISFIIILPIAFSYSILNKIFPCGYGDPTYLAKGYHPSLTHLFSFISVLLILPGFISISTNLIISTLEFGNLNKSIFIALIFALNIFSFNFSIRLQTWMIIIRCTMIAMFILIAVLVSLRILKTVETTQIPMNVNTNWQWLPLIRAILAACSSFDGFNSLNFIAYSFQKKDFKKPMIIAMLIETIFFVLICYSFNTVNIEKPTGSEIIKSYFNNLEFFRSTKKTGIYDSLTSLKWFPSTLVVLTLTGIINGCVIILKSIVSSFTTKYRNLIVLFLGLMTFAFTYIEIEKVIFKLCFLTNIWYFLSVSVLLFGKIKFSKQENKTTEIDQNSTTSSIKENKVNQDVSHKKNEEAEEIVFEEKLVIIENEIRITPLDKVIITISLFFTFSLSVTALALEFFD